MSSSSMLLCSMIVMVMTISSVSANIYPTTLEPLPTSFAERKIYSATCNTGNPFSMYAVPINFCIVDPVGSMWYSVTSGGALNFTTFVNATGCNGEIASNAIISTATGACMTTSTVWTYPIVDNGGVFGMNTSYTGGNCELYRRGPIAYRLNTCLVEGDGGSLRIVVNGGGSAFTVTRYTDTACTTGATNQNGYGNVCLAPPPQSSWSLRYSQAVATSSSGGGGGGSASGSDTGTTGGAVTTSTGVSAATPSPVQSSSSSVSAVFATALAVTAIFIF